MGDFGFIRQVPGRASDPTDRRPIAPLAQDRREGPDPPQAQAPHPGPIPGRPWCLPLPGENRRHCPSRPGGPTQGAAHCLPDPPPPGSRIRVPRQLRPGPEVPEGQAAGPAGVLERPATLPGGRDQGLKGCPPGSVSRAANSVAVDIRPDFVPTKLALTDQRFRGYFSRRLLVFLER